MAIKAKKSNTSKNKINFHKQKGLTLIVFALVFGGLGTYQVYKSFAASSSTIFNYCGHSTGYGTFNGLKATATWQKYQYKKPNHYHLYKYHTSQGDTYGWKLCNVH